jgi:hypothetical protein
MEQPTEYQYSDTPYWANELDDLIYRATAWANAEGMGECQGPVRGTYTGAERDGHREIQYQPDPVVMEIHCFSEWAPIPEPRDVPSSAFTTPTEIFRSAYGPMAMIAQKYMGNTRMGHSLKQLWSFCVFGGHRSCVILKGQRVGEELARVFEGPEEDRLVRGDSGRLRKATADECAKQATAWYNNLRNATINGMVESFQAEDTESGESYFIIQVAPTAYLMPGGVKELSDNRASNDPKAGILSNVAVWTRKDEDLTVTFEFLGQHGVPTRKDAVVTPDTIEATVGGRNRWDLDPTDHPIKTVTPIKDYFIDWNESTSSMMASIWSTDFSANALRSAVEFLTPDDQYACYEYATADQWPNTDEFDEWRTDRSALHRLHLEVGKDISMAEKVLQAISILPDKAIQMIAFDIREVLMRIVRFNLDVRGKYPYDYDLESPA